MIVDQITESKRKKISSYPVHVNRASDLGNPCIRYHVYQRTRSEEKVLHDVGLQYVFDLGTDFEKIVLKELAEAGIEIIEQQRSFEWKDLSISGHVDGLVRVDGKAYPIEIKSMSPYVFESIKDVTSLTKGKYHYLRKYPTQLNLYMLMKGIDKGVFIFKNKSTGAYKEIWMDLDYVLGEETLKRAEAVNAHVAAGTLPEPINDDMWCEGCAYAHICLPDHIGKEVEVDSGELATMLDRLEELKAVKKEYDELDAQIKEAVNGREKILAGGWFVTGKWCERKSYTVEGGQYWRRSVKKVS